MRRAYQVFDAGKSEKIREALVREGEYLLGFVNVVEQARMGLDELIERLGRAGIEAVLELSAQGVAGAKRRGKRGGEVLWHGRQGGEVRLGDRKIRVQRPRLRRREKGRDGEVAVPAYEAVQRQEGLGGRMLEIMMAGVSTRAYEGVIGEMAETVGVSKSSVSREVVAATEAELRKLCESRGTRDSISWTFWSFTWTDYSLVLITWWRGSAWMGRVGSTCWVWRRGPRKTRRWSGDCSMRWWSVGWK